MEVSGDRLMRCFLSVFPGATQDEISNTRIEDISGWDSLRGVTLLAVLDEEFGVQLDLAELLALESFAAVREHLVRQGVTP